MKKCIVCEKEINDLFIYCSIYCILTSRTRREWIVDILKVNNAFIIDKISQANSYLKPDEKITLKELDKYRILK